jgi:hypothetical protein
MIDDKQDPVWESFANAIEVEPMEYRVVTGASGLDHPVQMLGMDEKNKRLVLVSSESSARVAALMQVDVQTAMPEFRVVVARPIIFDLGVLARQLFSTDESALVDGRALKAVLENATLEKQRNEFIIEKLQPFIPQVQRALANVTLPAISQIVDVVQQAANLDWKGMIGAVQGNESVIDFTQLRRLDNLAIDRENGICPLPLYEFDEPLWQLLSGGEHPDDVRKFLKDAGIYQFFFPPPDQLALGIVDRGLKNEKAIIEAVKTAPNLGHPFGETELVGPASSIPLLLQELRDVGYVAEGEHGVEITPSGVTTRSSIKFRPRESLVQKLMTRLSLNLSVSPKDFMH